MTTGIHQNTRKEAIIPIPGSLITTSPKNIMIGKIAAAAPNPMTANHDNIRCGTMKWDLSYIKLRK